tara:strand:+ start:13632 stop:15356 length:1725 start_codon:yes stop_codon:yes gene_type:complete
MPNPIVFSIKNDFTGGINFRADQFQLAENESPYLMNMDVDPRGGAFSRAGIQLKHSTPVGVAQTTWNPKGLFNYALAGTPTIMLTTGENADPGEIWTSQGGNFSRLQLTGPVTLNVEDSEGASITQWEESVYFTRGIDLTSCKWTYPAFAQASTLLASGPTWQPYITPTGGYMPKARHCRNHANKLFVAHTREDGLEYPNRLRWSHEGLPEDWAEEDYIDITAGGNGIRGLAIVDGQLLIFKPKATYLLMGYENDNFQLVEVSTIHGVEFPGQIAEGDGGVYFFDFPKGLFFYNRNGMQDLFLRIEPIIINNEVGQDALDQITLSFVNNRLWISMPYNPTPNSVSPNYACVNFVFDSSIGQYGAYTMYQHTSGYGFVHGCDWRDSSDENWGLMLTPNTSNISPAVTEAQFVVYVDDYENAVEDDVWNGIAAVETLFPTTYTTSWFDESRYVQDKTFVGPNYVLKEVEANTTVTVQVFYNYNSTDVRRTQQIQLVPEASPALAGIYGQATTIYDGTAVYGTNNIGPSLISGQRLGRCRAVQLTFLGPTTIFSPPGRKWGINSIAYKFKRRNIKNR